MADELGSVSVSVKAETSQLETGLAKARAETEKFDKAANKAATGGGKKLSTAAKTTKRDMDALNKSVGDATNRLSSLPGPIGSIASRLGSVSSTAAIAGFAIAGVAAAVTGLAVVFAAATAEAEEWERNTLKTNAILKATGSAAGLTAHQLEELTNQVKRNTLATEQGAISAAQKLLTFRSVQGDTFREAIALSQDLAAVGFGSIDSAATQLGKALEDPVNGLAALRRVGVSFSPVQKQMIADFMETGRVAEAQRIILDALQQQVGGAGAAEASGLSGAYHRLSESVADFLENIGKNGPLQATTAIVNGLTTAIQALNDALFETGESVDVLGSLGKILAGFGPLGILASNGMDAFSASLRENNEAANDALILENELQKRAAAKSKIAADTAEAERKQGIAMEAAKKSQEAAAAAAKALHEQRVQTIGSLGEEVRVLGELSNLYLGTSMSATQLATTGEILRTQSMLRVAANSAEGESIAMLITKRDELQTSIDAETEKRQELEKAREDFTARIEGVQEQITAIRTETKVLFLATQAGEQYRIEQELMNAATKDFNELTEEQIAQIKAVAEEYASANAELKRVNDAFEESKEAAEKWSDSLGGIVTHAAENMQDALADFLFDPFAEGTKSMGERFSELLRKMAAEVAAAEIMKGLLGGLESLGSLGGGGDSGGGAGLIGGLSSVAASLFHEGGTVGQGGQPISVPAATFIGAPRFHNGLKPDEFPAILQQGEEVVPKDQVGRRGGVTNINNWNINAPDPNAFRASQRQINRAAAARVQTR